MLGKDLCIILDIDMELLNFIACWFTIGYLYWIVFCVNKKDTTARYLFGLLPFAAATALLIGTLSQVHRLF